MQGDATMQVVAVLTAVGLVLASRHLPRWWADRSERERRPARRARMLVTAAALTAVGAMVVVMAAGSGSSSATGDDPGATNGPDGREGPGELATDRPVPTPPASPQTGTGGS